MWRFRTFGHTVAHSSGLRNLSSHFLNLKYSTFLAEVEDHIAEFAFRLNEQNRLLHYQREQALGIISTTTGRLFPTEILFLAMNKPFFGISSGDVSSLSLIVSQLWDECYPRWLLERIKTFLYCFWLNLSCLELVDLREANSLAPIFFSKASLFTKKTPGRTLIFKINNRYCLRTILLSILIFPFRVFMCQYLW